LEHRGYEREVGAAENREADHVRGLVTGRRGDLRRCQSNARVDDFHAGITGGNRDLLGAVRVAIEAGLGDEQSWRPAWHRAHVLRDRRQLVGAAADRCVHSCGCAVLAEH
jgi:hypothetical protein